MIVRSVEFRGSVVSPDQPHPGDLPQIAFAGRSNVGKSSLINRVLGRPRKRVARVSAAPGKTRALNFYSVNGEFFLVDLPGSGYAKAPEAVREAWRVLVRRYVAESPSLRGVVYLVDARRPPSVGDRQFVERLARSGVPTLIALTKIDKLKARVRERGVLEPVCEALAVAPDQVVPTSARTGEGAEAVRSAMGALLEGGESGGGAAE